ncbi:MAG TPA: hypothetical protein DIU15_20645 [Deltaproteobacteria bacterium]|nr:hypothetical protein [Deltaproteobacteria bacterium]HCP48458.1 hypothetical protein [Deltaproteobacteria bacterium]
MNAALLIARREIAAQFQSVIGYVIVAALLLLDGLLFHSFAMSDSKDLSSKVLAKFFYMSSGITGAAGILLSMRLLAEESREKTIVLLATAPISDWQIVFGKWLSAFAVVTVFVALSIYLPLLIVVHGSVHPGHLASGYLGLLLIGAATSAMGTFCSSITSHQLVAGVLGSVLLLVMVTTWWTAKVAAPPLDDVLAYMSFYDKHFLPFTTGEVHTRAVVYYLSLTFLCLLGARLALGARRWR